MFDRSASHIKSNQKTSLLQHLFFTSILFAYLLNILEKNMEKIGKLNGCYIGRNPNKIRVSRINPIHPRRLCSISVPRHPIVNLSLLWERLRQRRATSPSHNSKSFSS